MHHSWEIRVSAAIASLFGPSCREPPTSISVDGFLQVAPQIVTWQGVSCKVTQGHSGRQRQILHSISGVAAVRGEDGALVPCLFAVLGPSGAGKTTFMDILSGRKRDSGQLTFGFVIISHITPFNHQPSGSDVQISVYSVNSQAPTSFI